MTAFAAVSVLLYSAYALADNKQRGPWVCAALMAFCWFMSMVELEALR